ncbi:MAG: CHAT domain-containing protein [Lewinella sp.]|nr:CHAT domain-containing protein [Lewinella sp.]
MGIKSAETLSAESRFSASNSQLRQYIEDNPKRYYDLSKAWFLLSYNLLQLGDTDGAWEANEQSLDLKKKLHADDLAENYMRFGAIFLYKGDYERALDQLFKAKGLPIEDGSIFARIDGYIAAAFQGINRNEEAEHFYRQSIATMSALYDDDLPAAYYNMGRFCLERGRLQEAIDTLDLARQLLADTRQRRDLLGQVYNALGEACKLDEPARARKYYENALAEYQTAFGPFNRETARTELNLARLEAELGNRDKAVSGVITALRSLCPADQGLGFDQMPEHPELALDRPMLAEVLGFRAALRLEDEKAEAPQWRQALEDSDMAVNLLLQELVFLGDDRSRLNRLRSCPYLAEPGILAAAKLFQSGDGATWVQRAFDLAERSKAVLFRANQPLPGGSSKAGNAQRVRLRELEAALALNPLDLSIRKEVAAVREEYMLSTIEGRSSGAYALFTGKPVGIGELQDSLDGESIVLAYFTGSAHYAIFAVTDKEASLYTFDLEGMPAGPKKGVKWLKLAYGTTAATAPGGYSKLDPASKLSDLEDAVKGYLTAIRKIDPDKFAYYSQHLYSRLVQPAEDQLKDRKKLIVIPDGPLGAMPFESLIPQYKSSKIRYDKLDYLVSKYAVGYQYSATVWVRSGKMPKWNPSVTFAGFAPVFDEETGIAEASRPVFDTAYQSAAVLRDISPDGKRFTPLAASKDEVEGIAGLFAEKGGTAKTWISEAATKKNAEANADGILHLATHSFAVPGRPDMSGLAFYQDGEGAIWYAAEIYGRPVKHRLVVLSSCESGKGDFAPGEGVLALPRAFLASGAENVISSLWKVYDKSTAALMQAFYQELLTGKDAGSALQAAKRRMIGSKETADPRQWGAFVLYGKG